MYDDLLSGANGSLRRFIGGVSDRFTRTPPGRDSIGAGSLANTAASLTAAQGAPYGSIAYRSDPNQYGSIASHLHPGVFGSDGALNPEHQQEQVNVANAGIQRRQAQQQDGFAQQQGAYTAQYLQPLITNMMASMQRQPVGRVNVTSPFPSRLSDDDSSDLEASR